MLREIMECEYDRSRARYLLLLLAGAAAAFAQQNSPRAAFVYPPEASWEAPLKQRLGPVSEWRQEVFFFGDGVKAEIVGFSKPLSQKEIDDLRAQLKELEQSHTKTPASPHRRLCLPCASRIRCGQSGFHREPSLPASLPLLQPPQTARLHGQAFHALDAGGQKARRRSAETD